MALITKIIPVQDGAVAAFVASTPAGDTVKWEGGALLLEFRNGHASSITITIAPVQTTAKISGVGNVSVPSRVLALAAGNDGLFQFRADEVSAYVNSSGLL